MMSNTSEIISFDELQRITKYDRPGDVERCLKKQGIHVFFGRKGVWTTVALINAAGGIDPAAASNQDNELL